MTTLKKKFGWPDLIALATAICMAVIMGWVFWASSKPAAETLCHVSLHESCAAIIETSVFEAESGQWLGLTRTAITFGSMPEKFVIDDRSGAGELWASRPAPRSEKLAEKGSLALYLQGKSVDGQEVILDKRKPLKVDAGKYTYTMKLAARTVAN